MRNSVPHRAGLPENEASADEAAVATACCHAHGEKHWVTDPEGIAWEHFHALGSVPTFSERKTAPAAAAGGCCAAEATQAEPVGIRVDVASCCC